jgi:hypothetical protein
MALTCRSFVVLSEKLQNDDESERKWEGATGRVKCPIDDQLKWAVKLCQIDAQIN